MPKSRSRDLSVGVLFTLALLILALTIMAVGGESRLFVQKAAYRVHFPNVEGLRVGSPVKMAGIQVGSVTAMYLSADPNTQGIEVRLGVDRALAGRVRTDSRAAMRVLQILSGEKFVEIIAGGEADSGPLPEGSVIEPIADMEFLEQAAVTAENLNEITISLQNILGSLERGEGLIGQMLIDPEFGKQGLEALRGSLENVQVITHDLLEGRGFAGRILRDEGFASRVDELSTALQHLARVTESLDLEKGGVGALLQDGGAGQKAVENFEAASESLREVAQRLERPEGLIGRLLNDPEYSEGLAWDLRATTRNLAEISGKINRGEGTLGALVNDRTLYDGMEDVVAGANDSKFARWLTRHYRKKGIQAEE